jgi:predicted phosphate transport protein (TIGR00153 family)
MLGFLVPTERKFFPMFESATSNLVKMSIVLKELVNTDGAEKRKALSKQIEDLEHAGDKITHDTLSELSSTFITPFDREDIHALTAVLDDIADFIHGASKRMELYKVHTSTAEIIKLGDLIEKSVAEVDIAVKGLGNLKSKREEVKEALVRINSLENNADDVFDLAIAHLFENEKDPINLIKIKEILQILETATDKCEDVADVIKGILIKYS